MANGVIFAKIRVGEHPSIMNKKTRTLLFFILLFCFLAIAPSIVFYSWGYRFNFETKKIVKTGAFYFKVLPKSAQISIAPLDSKGNVVKEKETIKKTDFFFGAALIENLLPKKYEIEITKDGFHAWKKILELKENQVAEAKNIVLVPQDIGINLLTKNLEDFFVSPDEKIIILKETAESSSTSSLPGSNSADWSLKTFEVQNNLKSQLMDSKNLLKDGQVYLLDLKFSSDSERLLLKVEVKQHLVDELRSSPLFANARVKYYLLDLTQASPKAILLDFLGDELRSSLPFANARVNEEYQDISFHPNNSQQLIMLKNGAIFEADIAQKKISQKLLENVKSFQIFNQDFYYLDNSGFLFKTDFSFSNPEKINKQPFSLEKDGSWQIDVFSGWIFISDGQKIYFLNLESNSFEKFFETNKQLEISPDSKKIAYASDYEIWILFLKPELGQPQKESKEQLFIARFSEKMGEIFFFTDHYLIFNSGGKIKIAETDDRDIINIVDLAEFESPKIFWNQIYKKLFILSNGNFYSSKMLIP